MPIKRMRSTRKKEEDEFGPVLDKETQRLKHDWTMVSPEDVRPSVEKWRFHLETLEQFCESPRIAAQNTAYFKGVKAYKAAGGTYWAECTTDAAIVARVEAFRRLYQKIRRRGYRMSPPIHVDIRRDGGIDVYDGHHRAAIAVFLDLSIAAKIRDKHPAWVARVTAAQDM